MATEAEIELALKLLALVKRCNAEAAIVNAWLGAANKRLEQPHGRPNRLEDAPTWPRYKAALDEVTHALAAAGT